MVSKFIEELKKKLLDQKKDLKELIRNSKIEAGKAYDNSYMSGYDDGQHSMILQVLNLLEDGLNES